MNGCASAWMPSYSICAYSTLTALQLLFCQCKETSSQADRSPEMTPVTFNGCLGWLHGPADGAGSKWAVLICPGLMRDGLYPYCSFRLLADELAAAGYWCLRFDYPGTGDSCEG